MKPALTPLENLAFWATSLGGGGLSPRAALARLGLEAARDLPTAHLSAGQKRRAALARLIVAPRALWLLDEPATALDTDGRAILIDMMRVHLVSGGLIVAATHAPLDIPSRTLRLGAAA